MNALYTRFVNECDVFFYSNKLSGPQESCEASQISDDTVAGGGLKLLIIEDGNE